MGSRLSALSAVIALLVMIGVLPGATGTAGAEVRSLTVATHDLEPFVMSRGNIKSGFTIDLLDQIAKRTGWTYSYVDGGGVKGMLKMVADGRADLAACNISITAERERFFEFSQPIIAAGQRIIVPADSVKREQPGLVEFLKLLFSKTMAIWFWAALVLVLAPAHIIWLTERRSPNSAFSKAYFPGIFQAFEWGLSVLANGSVEPPRRWPLRLMTLLGTFVGIIFVAFYTAILTANLTVEKINSEITRPVDLVGKAVCTIPGTTSASNLSRLGVAFTGLPKIEDCYSGLKSGAFDAVVFDDPVVQYYIAHDGAGAAEVAGPIFKNEDYGVVFPLGSDLRRKFDDALLSIQEDGEYDLLIRKWFGTDP